MPRKIQLQTLSEERLDPFHFQYPSPFPVGFEDDDALIHDKGSLHSAWLLANDFASAVFDDEAKYESQRTAITVTGQRIQVPNSRNLNVVVVSPDSNSAVLEP